MLATGATALAPRRLQRDALFDFPDDSLKHRGCVLRVRVDGERGVLTFKGAPLPGIMKVRDEHETAVDDVDALLQVLEGLGYRVWFRYEKYREEFSTAGAVIAIDETPIGTYVEIEGADAGAVIAAARALGRSEDEFIRRSYRSLFVEAQEAGRIAGPDMLFAPR